MASKLEEEPARLRDIINVFDYLLTLVAWTRSRSSSASAVKAKRVQEAEQDAIGEQEKKIMDNPLLPDEIKVNLVRNLREKGVILPSNGAGEKGKARATPDNNDDVDDEGARREKMRKTGPVRIDDFRYEPMDLFAQKFYDRKEEMVVAEMQILKRYVVVGHHVKALLITAVDRLGFHVQVQHPYSAMVNYLRILELTQHPTIPQRAWNYLNDSSVPFSPPRGTRTDTRRADYSRLYRRSTPRRTWPPSPSTSPPATRPSPSPRPGGSSLMSKTRPSSTRWKPSCSRSTRLQVQTWTRRSGRGSAACPRPRRASGGGSKGGSTDCARGDEKLIFMHGRENLIDGCSGLPPFPSELDHFGPRPSRTAGAPLASSDSNKARRLEHVDRESTSRRRRADRPGQVQRRRAAAAQVTGEAPQPPARHGRLSSASSPRSEHL